MVVAASVAADEDGTEPGRLEVEDEPDKSMEAAAEVAEAIAVAERGRGWLWFPS